MENVTAPVAAAPLLSSRHLPALDGVRGIAILMVLLFHLTHITHSGYFGAALRGVLSNDWLGVDLFFVLSGFLITGILLDAKGQPGYFRNFYVRRSLRIFPLYYLVIAIYLVVLPRVTPTFSLEHGHPTAMSWLYWTYLSNHALIRGGNGVLSPTWSLGVEEQFYLVWPLLVFLVNRRTLLWLCPVLMVAVLVLRCTVLWVHHDVDLLSLWMACRLDALATGAWIAAIMRTEGGSATAHRWLKPLALVSLLGIATVFIGQRWVGNLNGAMRCTYGYTFIALLAGCLIYLSVTVSDVHPLSRLLTARWLTNFGKYSYALYLLHMPIQEIVRAAFSRTHLFQDMNEITERQQLLFYVINLTLVYAAALLSWNLYEKHFLKLKRFFPMIAKPPTASQPAVAVAPVG